MFGSFRIPQALLVTVENGNGTWFHGTLTEARNLASSDLQRVECRRYLFIQQYTDAVNYGVQYRTLFVYGVV